MKELLVIAISSALVSNVVLSQFLGICSFVGVSKKVETAAGRSGYLRYYHRLHCFQPDLSVCAAAAWNGLPENNRIYPYHRCSGSDCRDVLKEVYGIPVQRPGRVPAADHYKLRRTGRSFNQRAERLRLCAERCKRYRYGSGLHDLHRALSRNPRAY